MAGTIIADDIQHSTAGSVGTEYVVQGSAKHWVYFNGVGTVSVRDSFNNSSIADNGTGNFTLTRTNAMASTNHVNLHGGSLDNVWPRQLTVVVNSTSAAKFYGGFDNGARTDWTYPAFGVLGDLA